MIMIHIAICVGSACHLKGAHGILSAFRALLEKHQLTGKVEFEGSFCQGRCTEGVVIRIGDEVITNVSKENVYQLFEAKVLKQEEERA